MHKKKITPRKSNYKLNFVCIAIIFLVIYIILVADKFFLENAIEQSKFIINNQINLAVANTIANITKKNNLTTDNFCNINIEEGKIISLSANTILINKLCSQLAVSIPDEFSKLGPNQIKIPIGALLSSISGLTFLNTLGPSFKVKIYICANALIDYETKFISAGINQTNFQIWLNMRFHSQIINPFLRKEMALRKNFPLVNTIINGNVPNAYIGSQNSLKLGNE